MTPSIESFRLVYDHSIKYREPMISSRYPLGRVYPSNFLLDWTDIVNGIQTVKPHHTMVFPIAFREDGIDGPNEICYHAEHGMKHFQEVYASKKIYLLACVADDADVHLSLYSIYDDIINDFHFFSPFAFRLDYTRPKSFICHITWIYFKMIYHHMKKRIKMYV